MCAAPGSKTTQLIEMLHADMSVPFPGNHWGAGKLFGELWVTKVLPFPASWAVEWPVTIVKVVLC